MPSLAGDIVVKEEPETAWGMNKWLDILVVPFFFFLHFSQLCLGKDDLESIAP